MVVYEGCDCPVEAGSWIDCSFHVGSPCFAGSRVTLDVVQGSCHKIRLGGWFGDTAPCDTAHPPAVPCIGNLSIRIADPFEDCNGNGIPDENETLDGGDLSGDGKVNLYDWALFADCPTAPCGSAHCHPPLYADITGCCVHADLDADGDADLGDVAAFLAAFTGR